MAVMKHLEEELIVAFVVEFGRFLENGLDYIVAELVHHDFLEDFHMVLEVGKEQSLTIGARASHCAFHHVRRYLLRAVVQKVIADETRDLQVDLSVVILKNLLDHVIAILIIDQ